MLRKKPHPERTLSEAEAAVEGRILRLSSHTWQVLAKPTCQVWPVKDADLERSIP